MGATVHLRVGHSVRAFEQEFAKGDLLEVPAEDAERYTAFWLQVSSTEFVYPFAVVSDDELAALTAPAPEPDPVPTPAPDSLIALRFEELRAIASEAGVADVSTKSQGDLIDAIAAAQAAPAITAADVPDGAAQPS